MHREENSRKLPAARLVHLAASKRDSVSVWNLRLCSILHIRVLCMCVHKCAPSPHKHTVTSEITEKRNQGFSCNKSNSFKFDPHKAEERLVRAYYSAFVRESPEKGSGNKQGWWGEAMHCRWVRAKYHCAPGATGGTVLQSEYEREIIIS